MFLGHESEGESESDDEEGEARGEGEGMACPALKTKDIVRGSAGLFAIADEQMTGRVSLSLFERAVSRVHSMYVVGRGG